MEFKKLSDVTLAETTSENTNVLIEDNGEVKKVAMDQIKVPQEPQKPQVQANWNEADETSPAFILNKPEKMGGYTYFAFSSNGEIFKTDNFAAPSVVPGTRSDVSRAEFEEAYKTTPIMLIPLTHDSLKQLNSTTSTPCPCAWYYLNNAGYPHISFVSYNGVMDRFIVFSDGNAFND